MSRASLACALTWALVGASGCTEAPPRTAWTDALPAGPNRRDVVVVRNGDVLGYSGSLTAAGLRQLRALDDPTARALLIRSPGGEIGASIDFAEWVRERGLELRVVDYCVSSCANYVFPAARTKRVMSGGAVAWHGDALQHDANAQVDQLPPQDHANAGAYLAAMRSKEAAFFERIDVNECMCRVGNEWLGAHGLYSMSETDMERFGVKDILEAPEDSAEIAPDLRRKLGLTFVAVPSRFERATVCP